MSHRIKIIRYVIAIPKLDGDEGYFLFLKVERTPKFRTKKIPDPQLEERAKF
jgi:hypothetical protein